MKEIHPKGSQARILLSSVFGPYAQDDAYGSRAINPMELYHNQVTRGQGSFSLRSFHRSWGILMIQGNINAPCAVLDFPTREAFAKELTTHRYDIVGISSIIVNIGKVLSGDWTYVSEELKAVAAACAPRGAILKVIFENDYLQDEHIIRLCELCTSCGIAFVKTSSGYGFVKQANGDYNYRGATDHHLALMRRHSGPDVRIKAAGGVRTLDDLLRVRALGVTRVGATATEAILHEAVQRNFAGPVPPGLTKTAS